jgi:photosystem II stability/assembly factor-like uncharacterized protein
MQPKFKFLLISVLILFVFSACNPLPQTTPLHTLPSNTDTATLLPPTEAPVPPLANIKMLNAKDGWAWSTTSQLFRTADGGQTWIDRTPQELQSSLYGSSFLDAQNAWLPVYLQDSNRSGLLHTTDGGQTWSEYPFGPASGIHFTDALNGWAVSDNVGAGNIYFSLSQTSDGGKTWAPILVTPQVSETGLPPGTIHLCNMCSDSFYYDPGRMILVYGDMASMEPGGSVTMEVSFDLGQTWRKSNLPLPQGEADALVASNAPVFFDDRDGLLPVHLVRMNSDGTNREQRMVFYATQDGGKSWSLLPGILDSVPTYTSIQVDSSQDVFIVGDKVLYASHDRARTWQTVASDLDFSTTDTRSVSAIDFINASTGWSLIMVNQTNSLYKTTDGGVHWTMITPLLAHASPVTVTIDASIPTPTLVPTPTLELTPTPNVAFDSAIQAYRVKFAPYGTWVDISSTISANTSKRYVLSAMQGQVMSVSISQGPPFSVDVAGADGKALSDSHDPHPFWRGVLPSKQDYIVTVRSQGSGPFTLRIAINPPGQATQNLAFDDPRYLVIIGYTDEFAPMNVQFPITAKGTPLVTLYFIDQSFYYPTTNLSEAALLLTATADPVVVSTCTQPLSQPAETVTGQETVNGYTFTRSESNDMAAGNIYDQISYRTAFDKKCFEVVLLIHSTNLDNYPAGTVVEFDRNGLLKKFEAVLATFIAK